MERTVEYSFKLNISVMRLLGLYPPEKYKGLYKAYAFVIYILGMIPSAISCILGLVFHEDLATMDYNALVMTGMIFYCFKLLPCVRRGSLIKNCIKYFDSPYFIVVNVKHKTIIEECVTVCRRNSKIFFAGCIVALSGFVGQVFLRENPHELPLNVWLPNGIKKTPVLYYTVYFLLLLGSFYAGLACSVIDPLIGGLSHHATAQLKVVKETLQHLDEYLNQRIPNFKTKDTTSRSRIIYTEIKQCIQRYQAIINFVTEYESCFSPVVFTQFMESGLVIGVCCYQISKMSVVDLNFLIMINYLGILFFQVFFYCYYGTLLVEENETFARAIYMSRWYKYNMESQRALIILMERSKRPMIVTAGKIFDLSLETFTIILKRSYSLLAVLKNY